MVPDAVDLDEQLVIEMLEDPTSQQHARSVSNARWAQVLYWESCRACLWWGDRKYNCATGTSKTEGALVKSRWKATRA